jgi:hypothetical protein
MSQIPERVTPADEQRTYSRGEVRRKRILFWLGIAGWVVVLMIPFSLVMLAVMGEFSFPVLGNFPDNRARVWMVMERDERGVAYSVPSVAAREETSLAVQTNVRYLLWEGENEALQYCQTYTRESSADAWALAGSSEGACGEAS